ncbi:phage portal protein (plasmid) [Apilactobacillus apisilvae]|uniref:Phage portal protein n=1 Tax=Apilactobacillus apisilvae TaxID=2923364 RepID=A0ABY4PIY0_9LACO|nr:phage portal protein [Apilactobacillus apisilvae]UQS85774.1 phage portal protein [Apilactobacillus apisilvae]
MPATNDLNAHNRSLPTQPNSVNMLNGQRYSSFQSNQPYNIPEKGFNAVISGNTNNSVTQDFKDFVSHYIQDHMVNQLPRIITLQRYYQADNDIHYWKSDKLKRADNRIASAQAKYITDFNNGLMLGKPLKFGYSNKDNDSDNGEDLINLIEDFNHRSDEPSHEMNLGKELMNTGRAFELYYPAQGTNDLKMVPINPNTCFIMYNTDVEPKELCAIRYYLVDYVGEQSYNIEVYTADKIYYFDGGSDPSSDLNLIDIEDNKFSEVPITEFEMNDERMGLWEPVKDYIDSYDKSLSEMANSQEDFSNSTMVFTGELDMPDPFVQIKDGYGHYLYWDSDRKRTTKSHDDKGNENQPIMVRNNINTNSNAIHLKPSQVDAGNGGGSTTANPDVKYLTKSLDANEWKIYNDQQLSDINKFTLTPDLTDENFSGQQTGAAMAYKLLGSLTSFTGFGAHFKKGIMRRMRLIVDYWATTNQLKQANNTNDYSNVTVAFTANLPNNIQDTIQKIQAMIQSGDISKQTIREAFAEITGVSPDEENSRVKDEADEGDNRIITQQQKMMKLANQAKQPNSQNDNGDDSSDDEDNNDEE